MEANKEFSGSSGYALERFEIFRSLNPQELERLTERVHWHNYKARYQIVGRQELSTDVYFVVSGTLRVILFSSAGKEVAFRDIQAGECFGEYAAIDGAPRSAKIIALTEVMIGSVSAETFRSILEEYPAVSTALLTHLIGTVRSLSERIFEFSTLAVKNRIHSELLRLAREGESESDGVTARISPAPTHADIAARISTHREAVTRELNELTKSGLIKRDGHTLIITDLEKLKLLVHEIDTQRAWTKTNIEDEASREPQTIREEGSGNRDVTGKDELEKIYPSWIGWANLLALLTVFLGGVAFLCGLLVGGDFVQLSGAIFSTMGLMAFFLVTRAAARVRFGTDKHSHPS